MNIEQHKSWSRAQKEKKFVSEYEIIFEIFNVLTLQLKQRVQNSYETRDVCYNCHNFVVILIASDVMIIDGFISNVVVFVVVVVVVVVFDSVIRISTGTTYEARYTKTYTHKHSHLYTAFSMHVALFIFLIFRTQFYTFFPGNSLFCSFCFIRFCFVFRCSICFVQNFCSRKNNLKKVPVIVLVFIHKLNEL